MLNNVKYINGLATQLAGVRHLRTTYTTNRAFKALETFTHLRNCTTSNSIVLADVKNLRQVTGVSYNTLQARLQWAQELGLLTVTGKRVYFTSYKAIADAYALPLTFTNYEYDNQKHKLEQVFKAIVFNENKALQHQGLKKRIERNPQLREQLKQHGATAQDLSSVQALRGFILYKQNNCLKNAGLDGYDFFMRLNADDNISSKGLGHILTGVNRNCILTDKDVMLLKTTGAYFRRSLAKVGIIETQASNVVSDRTVSPRMANGAVNPHVNYRWLPKQKKREFLRPTYVSVLLKHNAA
jgi:hypothetical protein